MHCPYMVLLVVLLLNKLLNKNMEKSNEKVDWDGYRGGGGHH
jgi:hypothetical protein